MSCCGASFAPFHLHREARGKKAGPGSNRLSRLRRPLRGSPFKTQTGNGAFATRFSPTMGGHHSRGQALMRTGALTWAGKNLAVYRARAQGPLPGPAAGPEGRRSAGLWPHFNYDPMYHGPPALSNHLFVIPCAAACRATFCRRRTRTRQGGTAPQAGGPACERKTTRGSLGARQHPGLFTSLLTPRPTSATLPPSMQRGERHGRSALPGGWGHDSCLL